LFSIVLTGFWSDRPNLLAEPERAAQRVRVDPGQPVRHPLLHQRGQRFRRIVQLNVLLVQLCFNLLWLNKSLIFDCVSRFLIVL
jgi:hypothetical protein